MPNLLSLSVMQDASGSLIIGVFGLAAAFVLAFIFTWFGGGVKNTDENVSVESAPSATVDMKNGDHVVYAPIKGTVKDIKDVDDKIFSQELIGKGVAIEPVIGKVYAPMDGKIETMMKSNHAIGIISNEGVECLIHVGLDTVNLEGKYYTAHVKQDQEVKKGDLLLEFDIDQIKAAGYDLITPIIITNTSDFAQVAVMKTGACEVGDGLLTLKGEN